MESLKFTLELRKRKESSYLEFTSNDLRENPNKILTIMKREFIDLKSWFLIIVKILFLQMNLNLFYINNFY